MQRLLPALAAIITIGGLAIFLIFSGGEAEPELETPAVEAPLVEVEPTDENPHLQACTEDPEDCYHRAIELTERQQLDDEQIAEIASLFEGACANGLAVACHDRAVMADEAIGQAEDITEAILYYGKACTLGHEPACAMGRLLTSGAAERGPELWIANCDAGELEDCIQLGLFVEAGGELPDGRTAIELLEHACEEGQSDGCYWLARHLDRIGSETADEDLETLYQLACDGGMGRSCSTLARRLDARGDSTSLIPTLERSCELQDGHGCYHLGLVHSRGDNTAAAIDAFGKGCELWHGESCQQLGQALLSVPDEESAPHFERGCQMGVAAACFNFAVHLNTESSPPPFERSRRLLEQACTGDHLQACAFLATMLRNGQGGPANPARANELSQKACDGGVQMACSDHPRGL